MKILRKLHFVWYMFMVALVFFIMYPLFYYATRKRERNVFLGNLRKFWCKLAFKLGFYGHHFEYKQPIDFSKPMVIVANHSSYLDTPLICVGIAGDYHFMGKVELLKHPVLKLFFQTVDVPVDRDSKIASYRALKKVEQNVKEGQSLILYPEGTMSLIAPEMLEFKSGAFKIAIDCDVPILPVTFLNNYELMPGNGKTAGSIPGVMKVFVHQPIDTAAYKAEGGLEKLSSEVFNIINQKLQNYANR